MKTYHNHWLAAAAFASAAAIIMGGLFAILLVNGDVAVSDLGPRLAFVFLTPLVLAGVAGFWLGAPLADSRRRQRWWEIAARSALAWLAAYGAYNLALAGATAFSEGYLPAEFLSLLGFMFAAGFVLIGWWSLVVALVAGALLYRVSHRQAVGEGPE